MIRKIKKIISYILLPVILIGKLHNNRILDLWNFIIIKFHTYRILSLFLNFGKNSLICTDFTTNHPESISIGDNCIINKHVILTCWNSKSHDGSQRYHNDRRDTNLINFGNNFSFPLLDIMSRSYHFSFKQ